MKLYLGRCFVIFSLTLVWTSLSYGQSSDSVPRTFLNQYCTGCHNEKLRTGGLALDTVDAGKIAENAELWEKVIRKLRAGVMPPPGMKRPDAATYDGLTTWLEGEVDRKAAANVNPGTKGLHRLNRAEYANAIRDLVDVEVDAENLLPQDDSSNGFDNIAGSLSISSGISRSVCRRGRKDQPHGRW